MKIIENPMLFLFIALGLLIFFLTLFKYLNKAESKKSKTEKKDSKTESVTKEEKKDSSNDVVYSNYLYDRFVSNPTKEDQVEYDSSISSAFLTEDEYQSIRNNKVEIKVKDTSSESALTEKELLYKKIESMTTENTATKEKLLEEFNSLSREMKLLLIENIMQQIK